MVYIVAVEPGLFDVLADGALPMREIAELMTAAAPRYPGWFLDASTLDMPQNRRRPEGLKLIMFKKRGRKVG